MVTPPIDVSDDVKPDGANHDSAQQIGLRGEAHTTTVPAG
jgi:hypothetical protein